MKNNYMSPLQMLEYGINNGDYMVISQAIRSLQMQPQYAEVKQILPCYLHDSQNNYFIVDELYFCPNNHTFCLFCIQQYHYTNFLNYGYRCEYACPICPPQGLLYRPENKTVFLQSIFGFLLEMGYQMNPVEASIDPTLEFTVMSKNLKRDGILRLLNPASTDYSAVYSKFYMPLISPTKYRLEKIYAVENAILGNLYNKKMIEIGNRCNNTSVEVWHGTGRYDVYEKICREGFKIGGIDVKNQHGAAYGQGVNAGADPTVCMIYTQNCGYLLLCDGIPGKISQSSEMGKINGDCFKGGNVWVFFKREQVLPRYLIKFETLNA
ncbi:hypothetical protein SteCoe_5479 [Stentor coeruleus]|uniref:PARP catalytic domain-containing protein n=1 Tax=Stentor coeruleus TaxID=5963 RepID=A0A1R2CSD6_9CILI|nr:hypothetical protein SteCoe_5479 [Stentor coeruleus]